MALGAYFSIAYFSALCKKWFCVLQVQIIKVRAARALLCLLFIIDNKIADKFLKSTELNLLN